ncbi:MAG: hypothetical protein ACLU9Q_10335 [Marvinbryantia sp.]|uniref:hypothetical protein n=1 Tax=Marvinbryantia sp. TaxID=2496532 RepID=UPI00399B4B11
MRKIFILLCAACILLLPSNIVVAETYPEVEWNETLMSGFFVLEPDEVIELTDNIALYYYNIVLKDTTFNWRLVLTEDEFDIYDYMEGYHKAFKEDAKNERIHCLIYCAEKKEDRTSTCIRLSDQSIDATVHKYVSGETMDANLMFTGEYIKERVVDVDTGFYYDYDTGETGTLDEVNDEVKEENPVSESSEKKMESQTEYVEKVWIPSSGSKYHRKSTCSGMDSPREVSRAEAEQMGYEPCKRCY